METFKEVKETLFDAAKSAEEKVVDVAKDIGERAREAKDKVMEVADRTIDKIKDLGSNRNDVLEDLREDHEVVSDLFEQIFTVKTADQNALDTNQGLFAQLKYELETHVILEEKLFYPVLQKYETAVIKEALAEHQQVKQLLSELAMMNPQGVDFRAKLEVLQDQVKHHVCVEEDKIFDLARKNLSAEQLDKLGIQLEQERLALDDTREVKTQAPEKGTDKARGSQAKKTTPRGAKNKKAAQGPTESPRHRTH